MLVNLPSNCQNYCFKFSYWFTYLFNNQTNKLCSYVYQSVCVHLCVCANIVNISQTPLKGEDCFFLQISCLQTFILDDLYITTINHKGSIYVIYSIWDTTQFPIKREILCLHRFHTVTSNDLWPLIKTIEFIYIICDIYILNMK